ncbi:MAG TPA: hypothetical protein VGE44_09420, partial [Daejeonella sp.]|uniref:hypothetical protein n=1 Tax=Daejeonella sp. TaxID=2805397 RepID=UPI002EDBB07C
RKKFERNQLDGFKLKFTYGYFKRHAESKYVIKTLINHFNTLCAAFNSIFKVRQRDTLKLPDRDCNCVMVEFAPGIVCYTNPAYNQLHDLPSSPLVLRSDAKVPVHAPFSPSVLASPEQRTEGILRLGDSLGQLQGPLGAFFKRRQ